MSTGFFRKSALEKLSTPEKLDQLIKVTSPKSWIALSTILLALIVGITWALFGTVKTKLNVMGVILGGEVHEVVSTSQGQLIKLNANIGDVINEGDTIAIIEQPKLAQQVEAAKAVLTDRKFELNQLLSYGNQDSQIKGKLMTQNRTTIQSQINTEKNNLNYLKSQLDKELNLLSKGLITHSQVMGTKQRIEGSKNTIEQLKSQMVETSSQQLNIGYDLEQKVTLQKQRIADAERNLNHLKEQYDLQTNIRSSYNGEVVEVLTDAGVVVGQGTPLFKLKNNSELAGDSNKLKGIIYIPSQDGKKIKKGMQALIVPSTVQPQEHGFIKGKVTYVSDFPITQQGMMTSVKNDQLVQGLLSMGALFEVFVEFEENPDSFSGYQWTSANGPDLLIKEGTSCMGKITIKEEPPANIVIPSLKKFFELY